MAQCIAVLPWLLPMCTEQLLLYTSPHEFIPGHCDDPRPNGVIRFARWRWCAINASDAWWMDGFKAKLHWVHCQREWQEELYEALGLISNAHMPDNGTEQVQDIICFSIIVLLLLAVYKVWPKECARY